MSNISSKVQVYEYLKKNSRMITLDRLPLLTTISIAESLNLSRSLTSQYLNELVKENSVIKVCSRPVYYLDKREIEKKFHVEIKQIEFLSIKELFEFIKQPQKSLKNFEKAIGNEGSLQYCISQMKSTLLYPDGGLPVLLYGKKGVGKSYLVKLIYEYCLNSQLLNAKANFIRMKILRRENVKEQEKELFGYCEDGRLIKKGKLEESNNGILYLQDIENLSEECQELLAEYISNNQFKRVNDETNSIKCRTRVIMSCQEEPQEVLTQNLILNIPVICNIPELKKRNDDEQRQFILKFFKEEQEHLDISIYLPKRMLVLLMKCEFESNIHELKKCIKSLCANAYAQNKGNEDKLFISMYHLPITMLKQIQYEEVQEEQGEMLRIDTLEQQENNNKILMMWDQIISIYTSDTNSLTNFMQEGEKVLRHYYDILVFQENYSDERLESMERIVSNILKSIKASRNIILPINCGYVLTRMILSSQMNNTMLKQWEVDHKDEVKEIISMMKQSKVDEFIIAKLILKQIYSHVNIRLHDMNLIFLMINIALYNKDIHSQDTVGVILSHGYSTASSIADAANSLLSTYIFEAIDMPLDTTIQEVSNKLDSFISENRHIKNIILLVDMGSLEDIGDVIADSVNVGVINNISTSLALNIGMKILQKYELEEILKTACEEAQCHYKVLSVAKKEKAIVFTNDVGTIVSAKLSKLFHDSLPKEIELKMMEYDYDELLKNGSQDILFKKYEVLLMIKPYNLKIENVNSVTLEEIMNFENVDKVNQVLQMYLNKEEIESFDQRLLKNFSMLSVMENLTILNVSKLLDYVSESINALQHIMNRHFQSRTIIGIYIHICFLVERLVTKTALEKYENLDEFVNSNALFIENVNKSFETMLTHYNVKLPVSEIAYLYEYIENEKEKNTTDEVF